MATCTALSRIHISSMSPVAAHAIRPCVSHAGGSVGVDEQATAQHAEPTRTRAGPHLHTPTLQVPHAAGTSAACDSSTGRTAAPPAAALTRPADRALPCKTHKYMLVLRRLAYAVCGSRMSVRRCRARAHAIALSFRMGGAAHTSAAGNRAASGKTAYVGRLTQGKWGKVASRMADRTHLRMSRRKA